jgi:rare lipoprotein A
MSRRTAWVWIFTFLVVFWGGLFLAARAAVAKPVEWRTSVASVYDGIGLGGAVACKGYWPGGNVVAHKTLPCGTKVRFLYRGRKITARVWDRGPFIAGRDFDLDVRVQRLLRFPWGVDALRWRIVR